jgi:hypothetical protein
MRLQASGRFFTLSCPIFRLEDQAEEFSKYAEREFSMGFAKFTATDPFTPSSTIEELYNLLSDIDGIMDWAINSKGELTVEYDHNRINEMEIEQALSGLGLQLNFVAQDPYYPKFLLGQA